MTTLAPVAPPALVELPAFTPTARYLWQAKQRIRTPRRWLKNSASDGRIRFCMIGGLEAVAIANGGRGSDIYHDAFVFVSLALAVRQDRPPIDNYADHDAIAEFNDARRTRHRDVMEVMDAAIDAALKAGK